MAAYPAGVVGNTADNLKAAAAGENLEWTKLYQDFAAAAKTEGLGEAYEAFSQVAQGCQLRGEIMLPLASPSASLVTPLTYAFPYPMSTIGMKLREKLQKKRAAYIPF